MLIEELLNRTRLEKLLRDSYGNYCVQTALDYAEPGQRALLVEGIRPVLPLIRNTPYGKRIQNKLQREQMDHYGGGGGYQHPQSLVNHALGTSGIAPQRHMSAPLHANGLGDIYGGQGGGLYGQSSFGSAHLAPQHPGLGGSIDGYVLQGNSSHMGLASSHHHQAGGLSGAPFAGISPFGGAALTSSLSDPYQRSFGYGM